MIQRRFIWYLELAALAFVSFELGSFAYALLDRPDVWSPACWTAAACFLL